MLGYVGRCAVGYNFEWPLVWYKRQTKGLTICILSSPLFLRGNKPRHRAAQYAIAQHFPAELYFFGIGAGAAKSAS